MLSRRSMVVVVWLACSGVASAREKTDIVYFTNGDRIHCEIKELKRGKLTVKSIGFGTIAIEWDKISRIESDHPFQVELESGTRYIGAMAAGGEDGQLEVETASGTNRLDHARIVNIEPFNESFFDAIEGAVDIGYDFTAAAEATSWSLGAEAKLSRRKFDLTVGLDSQYKTQSNADPVNRQNLSTTYVHNLENRWFGFGLGQVGKNANQSLEFRGLGAGGGGRRLLQTNRTNIRVLVGIGGAKEKFTDTDFSTSVEAVTGFLFDTYRFTTPEIQITTALLALPSLTDSGRVRLQFDAKLRMELVKDLFWQLSMFESFDSRPPSATAERNDFGLTTSFGLSF